MSNTFNTTSLCSPSRASILTGAYAHNHGVKNNHTPWTGQMTTFLEYLSQGGYDTAFIGKWHMPGEGLPEMPFLDLFVSYTYREGQGAYFDCPMIVNGQEMPSRRPYISEEITDYAIEFMQENLAQGEEEQEAFLYLSVPPGRASSFPIARGHCRHVRGCRASRASCPTTSIPGGMARPTGTYSRVS